MTPKLEKLISSPNFAVGAIDYDTGIMFYNDHPFAFVILIYEESYKVYLSVYDHLAPNDHLIITEASTLEEARAQAEEELKRIVNNNIH